MIEVRQLSKSYYDMARGQVLAVDQISFDAKPGEIYGLLGPNGAGKTTTLRILSTMLTPTGGTARVAGFDVRESPQEVRRRIGFLSASTGVYERLTGWEIVEYFGRLYDLPDDVLHPRMEHLFEKLQMQELRDRLGSKMSTGMKQKVSIARAIVHDPPVLILDEATAGLDVLASRALLDAIAELRTQGKCILFSTHIMREAERLCDRVGVIHRGKLAAEGTVAEFRQRFAHDDLDEVFHRIIGGTQELS